MRATSVSRAALPLTVMIVVASAATIGSPAAQQAPQPWIHVDVSGEGGTHVNLPLTAIEAIAPLVPELLQDGQLQGGHSGHNVPVAAIRDMWPELRDVGVAEFVTIQHKGPTVWRVARDGDTVLVDVIDRHWFSSDEVRVEMPWRVADALLSGTGDALNVRAARRELSALHGETIRIIGEDFRIWIDESRTQ